MAPDVDLEKRLSTLSAVTRSAWAKSWPNPSLGRPIEGWNPVHRHLADTAAIAGRLWDLWLAPNVKRIVSEAVGEPDAARTLAVWLAGVHDIGKISPAFAVQVAPLASEMERNGLRFDPTLAEDEQRNDARHEFVGHLAVTHWLADRHGFDRRRAAKLASVVAAHHGKPADDLAIRHAADRERLIGDAPWTHARDELLDAITDSLVTDDTLQVWRSSPLPQHALVLLSAIVIVADWITSNDHLFPLADIGQEDVDTDGRVERAWVTLDLPAPWKANAPGDDADLFLQRFGLPSPRPVQSAVMQLARTCAAPPLLIVEESMGAGKTEAALAAAEILATRFGLSGVFIGLPTQATADGMFTRALRWAKQLGLETPLNVFLGHGKSFLNDESEDLRMLGRFNSIGDRYHDGRRKRSRKDDDLLVTHQWFSSPKRGPLADLVAGTVDQALMTALRSKHVMLRHLAMAGKVVVIDEAHAYDAYMSVYLEELLTWLGAYRVPVVMLSATLPAAQRKAFVAAYEKGRPSQAPAPTGGGRGTRWRKTADDRLAALDGDIGYPAITTTDGGEPRVVLPGSTGESRTVSLERLDDDLDALADVLGKALSGGGTAAVIRNTVGRVQETAAHLRERLDGIPVLVAHSRFLGLDRAAKDRELLRLFGKKGDRPERMIVVASQVIEQSLDIDFDLMATDVAPVDLILQRAGRLHRHAGRVRPDAVADPRLILTGVDWSASPPKSDGGSETIYTPHLLLRTFAALDGAERLTLPDDIPVLVQRVYGADPLHPAAWDDAIARAAAEFQSRQRQKRSDADTFRLSDPGPRGLIGWISAPTGDPASDAYAQAAVRDSEPTLEVLVVQQVDGVYTTPVWLAENGGVQLPDNDVPDPRLARTVLGCSLRLPASMCRGRQLEAHIRELEKGYPFQPWHGSPLLRGELVLVFDADRTVSLGAYRLRYDPDDGLSHVHTGRTDAPAAPTRPSEIEALL